MDYAHLDDIDEFGISAHEYLIQKRELWISRRGYGPLSHELACNTYIEAINNKLIRLKQDHVMETGYP